MAKAKPVDLAAQLAQQVVAELHSRRESGECYPCSLASIAQSLASNISESQLRSALAKAPLKNRVVLAFPSDLSEVAGFREDLPAIATDTTVLRAICLRLCSPDSPLLDLKEASQLLTTTLRKSFREYWQSKLHSEELPDFLAAVAAPATSGKSPKKATQKVLHDIRFPLPWVSLSQAIVRELEGLRDKGTLVVRWNDLTKRLTGDTPNTLLDQARSCEPCKSNMLVIIQKEPHGLVGLSEECKRLAQSPVVFERVFDLTKKSSDNAVEFITLSKSKALSTPLAREFGEFLKAAVPRNQLSHTFSVVRVGTKQFVFRVKDVVLKLSAPVQAVANEFAEERDSLSSIPDKQPLAFEETFDREFTRIDRELGARNFVKLLDLRRALPQCSRFEFDQGLRKLRLDHRYSLESSEGNRVILSQEEREAGIFEGGLQLVYCRRRQ